MPCWIVGFLLWRAFCPLAMDLDKVAKLSLLLARDGTLASSEINGRVPNAEAWAKWLSPGKLLVHSLPILRWNHFWEETFAVEG